MWWIEIEKSKLKITQNYIIKLGELNTALASSLNVINQLLEFVISMRSKVSNFKLEVFEIE